MDIQTRKLIFIKEFLKIKNEELISQFENLLNKEKTNIDNGDLLPMSIEIFNKRIDMSLTDAENDNVTEVNELLNEISKWR